MRSTWFHAKFIAWSFIAFAGALALSSALLEASSISTGPDVRLERPPISNDASSPQLHASTANISGSVYYNGPLAGPIHIQAWQTKPGNRVLQLDGDGDHVATTLSDLSGAELTLQFWFKGPSMQSAVRQQNGNLEDLENEWSGQTNHTHAAPPQKGWIVASWNQFFILSHDGLLSGVYGAPAATNGHWHHVTMTWKQNAKGGFATYLDGQLITKRDSRNIPIPNYRSPVFIGARDGIREFTQGQIDEIAIWKRAWTEEEVHEKWNAKLTGSEAGLAALWNFDTDKADDASPWRHQGVFKGDACTIQQEIPGLGAPVSRALLDRPGAFQLTNIVAGAKYKVRAFMDLNADGEWNEGEPQGYGLEHSCLVSGDISNLKIQLDLPMPFWNSVPFYLLCTILALAGAGAIIRSTEKRRLHRRLVALEQLHFLEKERARIARDIHDDVGSSLTQIAWLSQMAEKDKCEPEKIELHTRKIAACSRRTIQALDEIVWAVNPGNDSLQSLIQYIAHHVHERLGESTINFRLKIAADLPAFWISSEVRHELFLAVKESLHNALKHAAATEIAIIVGVEDSVLTIQVEDNGCGFNPMNHCGSRIGNGLRNIRQRLDNLQGNFRIESKAGVGTKLALSIKLAPAPSCA